MKLRTILIVLLLLTAIALVGCASSAPATKAPEAVPTKAPEAAATEAPAAKEAPPAEEEKVTIVYWADPRFQNVKGMEDQTQEVGDYERILAEKFMEQHPNVTVEVETLQWNELSTKVAAAIAAGSPPDVLKDYLGRTGAYANQGLLEPLQDAIPKEEYDDILPSLVDLYTINGDLHGLPLFFWVTHLIGNTTIAKDAGAEDLLPDESGTWTFDQFEQALAAQAIPDERWPLAMQVSSEQGDYNTLGYFWGMGAKLYENGDYTHTALNSPEGVAALTKLVEWYNKGYIIPGVTTISNNDLLNAMYQGQSAITGGGLGLLPIIENAQKEGKVTVEWDPYIAAFPHAEGVKSAGLAAGPTGVVVFKQDDPVKRKWAIEFARFLASPDLIEQYCINANQFPARKSVGNPFEGDPKFTKVSEWIKEYGVEDMGLSSPTYAEVRVLLQPELQAAFLGKKTPEQALADYEKAANEVLSKNK